jgi:Putative zinc-finger
MMLSSATHPFLEKLELYLLNFLNEADRTEIELHLLVCEGCQQAIRELEKQIVVMQRALAPEQARVR